MDEDAKRSPVAQFYDGYRDSDLVCRREDADGEYLYIKTPVILAALVAFCSAHRHRVLLRGSCQNHPRAFPSLFREEDRFCANPKDRWLAYKYVLRTLRTRLCGTRWDRDQLGSILQHYGIKTPWLDVVQNLHTAIWFATHTLAIDDPPRSFVKPNTEEFGWISLYVDSRPGRRQLTVVDLSGAHSSRHVRPHAQQGLSFAMQSDPTNAAAAAAAAAAADDDDDDDDDCVPAACDSDFNTHQVARVQIAARSKHWTLAGHLFSCQFLFPAPEHDSSLRQLLDIAPSILEEARTKHALDRDTLGAVYTVGDD